MSGQGASVQIFPRHRGGSKKGVVLPPHPFKGPKCLRGVGVKECTWASPCLMQSQQLHHLKSIASLAEGSLMPKIGIR